MERIFFNQKVDKMEMFQIYTSFVIFTYIMHVKNHKSQIHW